MVNGHWVHIQGGVFGMAPSGTDDNLYHSSSMVLGMRRRTTGTLVVVGPVGVAHGTCCATGIDSEYVTRSGLGRFAGGISGCTGTFRRTGLHSMQSKSVLCAEKWDLVASLLCATFGADTSWSAAAATDGTDSTPVSLKASRAAKACESCSS